MDIRIRIPHPQQCALEVKSVQMTLGVSELGATRVFLEVGTERWPKHTRETPRATERAVMSDREDLSS
jgi:DNA-binding sugar fermentation-stimulating protein